MACKREGVDNLERCPQLSVTHQNAKIVTGTADNAVALRNVNKSYGNGISVLKNMNMTVPIGSIYGLLGSSGSGKSTVLSCIIGLTKFDSGTILLYGQKPGFPRTQVPGPNIGYMPQSICLYYELTIAETLEYFGTLGRVSVKGIADQGETLCRLLDLPEKTRRVSTLR